MALECAVDSSFTCITDMPCGTADATSLRILIQILIQRVIVHPRPLFDPLLYLIHLIGTACHGSLMRAVMAMNPPIIRPPTPPPTRRRPPSTLRFGVVIPHGTPMFRCVVLTTHDPALLSSEIFPSYHTMDGGLLGIADVMTQATECASIRFLLQSLLQFKIAHVALKLHITSLIRCDLRTAAPFTDPSVLYRASGTTPIP
jgi:hypothetical protein